MEGIDVQKEKETGAARKVADRVKIFEGERCEKLYFEVKE
jgi:hypothetical protein